MGQKVIISEQERNDIRKMYNLENEQDYVFDFVLTENEKYLFIMDQVFVAGGDGKSIGNIWENTHILSEILSESLVKQNILTESNKNEINNIVNNITWSKTLFKECLKNKSLITEGWWDDLGKKIGSSAAKIASTAWYQGVLPFLRWVRRSLYTGVGIVIDVVISILAVKTNAIVWIIVCLLDIYEIIKGEYDPQDQERRQMPYLLLICDLMGVFFNGGVSALFKKSANVISKQGIKKMSPTIVRYLQTLSTKIPSLSGKLKSAAKLLNQKMGSKSGGFVSILLRGIDNVITGLSNFLTKLLKPQGLKATAKGAAVYGSTELFGKGMENSKIGEKFGEKVMATNNFLNKTMNYKPNEITPEVQKSMSEYMRNAGLIN